MKVKDVDALREQISKDPREAFTKHQVWLFASEHNKTVPTVDAIPKDQYEARLKADIVAMLEEIDLQFDEICFYKNMGEWKTVPEIKAEYKAVIKQKSNVMVGRIDHVTNTTEFYRTPEEAAIAWNNRLAY